MFISVVAVAIVIILFLILDTIKPKHFPPGPRWMPLIGNLLDAKKLVKETGFYHLAWAKLAEKYGPVVGLRMGYSRPVIIISGRKDIIKSLGKEEFDGRPDGFVFKLRTMGERRGVIFTDGPGWKEQRRFSLRNLREFGFGKRSMETLIQEEALNLVSFLQQKAFCVPMQKAFKAPVLNSLWSLTAGVRYQADDPELLKFTKLLDHITRSTDSTGGIINHIPSLRFIAPDWSGYNKFISFQKQMWEFFKDIVIQHRKTLCEGQPRDLIDVFLYEVEAKRHKETTFTDSQLVALCKDLFAAGSETTSNSLSFAFLYMIVYPEVQIKVQNEIDNIVGRSRIPCLDDKLRMPYTSAVLTEIQRIANVGPMTLPHRALRDAEFNGFRIPKDSTVLMSIWSIHMDKEHWGDPEVFRPERFLDEIGNFVYDPWIMPFGSGRRRCLGETLARNSLFLFFTILLQRLKFSIPKGQNPPPTTGLDGFTVATQPFYADISIRNG